MRLPPRRPALAATALGWAILVAAIVVQQFESGNLPFAIEPAIGLAVVPGLVLFGYVVARPTTPNIVFRFVGVAVGLLVMAWAFRYMGTESCQQDPLCGSSIVIPSTADIGVFLAYRAGRGLAEKYGWRS